IGNVKGKNNWFYELARRAEEGTHPELGYHRLTAYDAVQAGVLAEEEIAEARRTLPEHVFKELFLAEAAADASGMFPVEKIQTLPYWDVTKVQASVRFWDKAATVGEYAGWRAVAQAPRWSLSDRSHGQGALVGAGARGADQILGEPRQTNAGRLCGIL